VKEGRKIIVKIVILLIIPSSYVIDPHQISDILSMILQIPNRSMFYQLIGMHILRCFSIKRLNIPEGISNYLE
jgi:hypothetical protein